MQDFVLFLQGKKTYVMALGGAIVVFLKIANLIDDTTYQTLLGLFGLGGLAALRAAKK